MNNSLVRDGGPEKGRWGCCLFRCLLGAGVLSDSLGSLRDSMLGKLSWKDQSDSSLDLSACDGGSLVVVSQSGCLSCDSLKHIIDKAVHDAHGFARNSSVRMNLLENLVDIDTIALLPPSFPFLVSSSGCFSLSCFLGSLTANFWWHVDSAIITG